MDPLERLIAVEEIKKLKARYFRYVDQQDWAGWLGTFCADVHFESDGDLGIKSELGVKGWCGNFVEYIRSRLTSGSSIHHGHMPEIDILGPDEATGIWSVFGRIVYPIEVGPSFTTYGRYQDKYGRENGSWCIAEVRVERLHTDEMANLVA